MEYNISEADIDISDLLFDIQELMEESEVQKDGILGINNDIHFIQYYVYSR